MAEARKTTSEARIKALKINRARIAAKRSGYSYAEWVERFGDREFCLLPNEDGFRNGKVSRRTLSSRRRAGHNVPPNSEIREFVTPE